MKKITFLLVFIISSITILAQDYSKLKSISLKDSIACKNAEPKVLECANYILSKPYIEDLNCLNASVFIIEWMGATPDYTFGFDKIIHKAIKSDVVLLAVYVACESKVGLNDRPGSYDKAFQLKYITLFLEYCENPQNKVNLSSKLKKLIAAKNEGKLKDLLSE